MLVIRDDPQIDLLVKIACGHGQGGAVASEVRKDGPWWWEEKDVFSSTSCPVEVNLSAPDQIAVRYPTYGRTFVGINYRRLVAWRLLDALFVGVEVDQSGGHAFTVLALSGAQKGPLPGADGKSLDLYWDDSMTLLLSGYESGFEVMDPVKISSDEITFQSIRVPSGELFFPSNDGDEVIFERQKYRVAIRRGRSEPVTGYLWMVGENVWAGIEFRQREESQEKRPSFLWVGPSPNGRFHTVGALLGRADRQVPDQGADLFQQAPGVIRG
jgi:hypothetical protein